MSTCIWQSPCSFGVVQRAHSRWVIRQRFEQRLLGVDEALERRCSGGAVNAIAGIAHHPVHQLLVGIGEIAELTQRHEVVLDVLDARFNAPFLLWIGDRAWRDEKAVAFGVVRIGTLHLGS